MKKVISYLKISLVTLVAMVGFSSCEEDNYWSQEDDYWYRETLWGSWRVVEVTPRYGDCPYYYDDLMYFSANGNFEMRGHDGYREFGVWTVKRGRVLFDFDDDGREDLSAEILRMDDGYVILDCRDYFYDSRYRLRMIRY